MNYRIISCIWHLADFSITEMFVCGFLSTWHRSSDLVVVVNRNLMNSLRVRGEWSSGGWEDWSQQIHVEVKHLALKTHLNLRNVCSSTFMRVSNCSASCSIPKKRASSSTPAEERLKIRKQCNPGPAASLLQRVSVIPRGLMPSLMMSCPCLR